VRAKNPAQRRHSRRTNRSHVRRRHSIDPADGNRRPLTRSGKRHKTLHAQTVITEDRTDRHEITLASEWHVSSCRAGGADQKASRHVWAKCRRGETGAPQMHTRGSDRNGDVGTLTDQQRHRDVFQQRPPDFRQRPGIRMFQTQQHHADAAVRRCDAALHESVDAVAEIVRDAHQREARIRERHQHRDARMDDLLPLAVSSLLSTGIPVGSGQQLMPVRLATTCASDTADNIADAVRELVEAFHSRNDCGPTAVTLVLFTATPDLRSAKPAAAARAAGWQHAQLLCLAEMPTETDVPYCLRALVFVVRGPGADPLKPVYLRGAAVLRPDLLD
jgi:chorismate mutase